MTQSKPVSHHQLKVIVPVGPKETDSELERWLALVRQEPGLRLKFSLSPEHPYVGKFQQSASLSETLMAPQQGRAQQINHALKSCNVPGTWFLLVHYDCQLSVEHLKSAYEKMALNAPIIYHYLLSFTESDTYKLLKLNEVGANFRSEILKLPFGDQGFLFSQDVLGTVGFFREDVDYGEDHCWIWQAHIAKIKVRPIPLKLKTSGRKYLSKGWAITTSRHLWLTLVQSIPGLKSWWLKRYLLKGL